MVYVQFLHIYHPNIIMVSPTCHTSIVQNLGYLQKMKKKNSAPPNIQYIPRSVS
jgi:hypothetical protein